MKNAAFAMTAILILLIKPGTAFGESAEDAWKNLLPEKLADSPMFAFVENDPKLPNVLLYGDSISMGYTVRVRNLLNGKANVYRLHANGNHSGKFIELMSEMHGTMRDEQLDSPWNFQWDVIHFNVGLHDLKYILDGKKDKKNGEQVSSTEVYQQNLHGIVAYLKELAPNARLIFATTTPVPEGAPGRFAGDAARYNKAAAEVMGNYPEIAINDLHSFTVPNHQDWWTRPGNVHFTRKGSDALGAEVARHILDALPGAESTKSRFVEKLDKGEKQTIVVYGTSLTNSGQWRRQFAAVLADKYGDKVVVKNGARSGSDSNWGLKNIKQQVFPHKPDVLFIEFSMNDAIAKRGTSIEKARQNLETMIEMTQREFPACEIILMSMNPSLRSGESLQRPKLAEYYDSYRQVAEDRNLQFIDNHGAWTSFLKQDGGDGKQYIPDSIHPNGLGTKSVITPSILRSIGVSFQADEIPLYDDPPPKKKQGKKGRKSVREPVSWLEPRFSLPFRAVVHEESDVHPELLISVGNTITKG